ncbi:hypothetical protein GCM10027348_42490 [Hymenobacter tenuis]
MGQVPAAALFVVDKLLIQVPQGRVGIRRLLGAAVMVGYTLGLLAADDFGDADDRNRNRIRYQ